jgi:hypothetical protein
MQERNKVLGTLVAMVPLYFSASRKTPICRSLVQKISKKRISDRHHKYKSPEARRARSTGGTERRPVSLEF